MKGLGGGVTASEPTHHPAAASVPARGDRGAENPRGRDTRSKRKLTPPGRLLWAALLAVSLFSCGREAPKPTPRVPAEAVRARVLLVGPWRFQASNELAGAENRTFDDSTWENVTVPHTWGEKPFRSSWYRTHVTLADEDRAKRLYLSFEGVATFAEVFVNGVSIGGHRGAFTRFTLDATEQLVLGDNVIAVRVTNDPRDTAESLPSGRGKQLYHLYGGIYRKVWLVKTSPHHIDPLDHGASGVYVTPSEVTPTSAKLAVKTLVRNSSAATALVQVTSRLLDRDGHEVVALSGKATVRSHSSVPITAEAKVPRPHLWGPDDPYLYVLRTEVSKDGVLQDVVEERTGFRDFRSAFGGFTLNGKPILLRGVGKHQETEDHQSAVSDAELREDFEGLVDLGVNMVRLAHYPHAPLEYDLADEKGILVWAENGHSNEVKVGDVGDVITREMVRQNMNHPSIVMWSVGNETGFIRVNRFAAIVKEEDPTRIVAYASNIGARGKVRYPDLDLIAHNTYRGWYHLEPWDFEDAALSMRTISESGGGEVITNHTDYGRPFKVVDQFEPEEYRQRLAEIHCQVVFRDHPREVPMYLVWIYRDFAIDKYKDARNTKGLVTYAGFKKDAYYLFRSFLRPDQPLVHLTSKTYFLRRGNPVNGVKAYSNSPALTLTVNGGSEGVKRNGEYRHENGRPIANVFHWHCALRKGRNELVVRDDAGHQDTAVVYYDGPSNQPAWPDSGLVRRLRSSNPGSPATYVDKPIEEQWPFYDEFDGSADNTFDRLPDEVRGARFVSTHRLSKPEMRTEISFEVAAAADVYLMATAGGPPPQTWLRAGFGDTGVTGVWRDNGLRRVAFRLLKKQVRAGERLVVPGATLDYVILVKEKAGA